MKPLQASAGLAAVAIVLGLGGCQAVKKPIDGAASALDRVFGQTAYTAEQREAIYQQGRAAKQGGDHADAASRFREAAEAGHAAAAFELGLAYNAGRGVEVDAEAAARWINRAAEGDEPAALYLIGAAYAAGNGVEKNSAKAAELLKRAAVQGHARAQYLLADAFYRGDGVDKDVNWAGRWYGKAALQGHAGAQTAYGAMWAAGLGMPKDAVEAYAWLSRGVEGGDQRAPALRDAVAKRMNGRQIAAARRRATEKLPSSIPQIADRPTIVYVQRVLARAGYAPGPVDGVIGPRTRSAIRRFQADNRKPRDGDISPALLEQLLESDRNRAPTADPS